MLLLYKLDRKSENKKNTFSCSTCLDVSLNVARITFTYSIIFNISCKTKDFQINAKQ